MTFREYLLARRLNLSTTGETLWAAHRDPFPDIQSREDLEHYIRYLRAVNAGPANVAAVRLWWRRYVKAVSTTP